MLITVNNTYTGCIKSCVAHWQLSCRASERNSQDCDADVTNLQLSILSCLSVWCCLMMVGYLLKMFAVVLCVLFWFRVAAYANNQR